MWTSKFKKHAILIVLIGPFSIPCHAAADTLKTSGEAICHTQQKEIDHWQVDGSTRTIVVFDDQHREKYRISTENGRVFIGVHEKIEPLDLERDGG